MRTQRTKGASARQLALFGPIREGPDWLEHPDLQAFLQAEGLADARIVCIGPRRSYAGKTWPHRRLIRLVSEGVHPIRWLLTLIHELAHIADYRQRLRDFEQEKGRPFVPGRNDGRIVWRMDRIHGARWRKEFIRLTEAAIAAGLFPGNEERVREIARTATTAAEECWLDLRADPRVDAEALAQAEEAYWRQRQEIATAQASPSLGHFKPGQIVQFEAGREGILRGTIIRVNRRSYTIQVGKNRWRVPPALVQSAPASSMAEQAAVFAQED